MCEWKGKPVEGPDFYSLLCRDDEFCAELGRAVLAAGRLETQLKQYIMDNARNLDLTRATLGRLITVARAHCLLSKMLPALEMLRDQRNYLIPDQVESLPFESSGPMEPDDPPDQPRVVGQVRAPSPDHAP
jgi:hypothetical protein